MELPALCLLHVITGQSIGHVVAVVVVVVVVVVAIVADQ